MKMVTVYRAKGDAEAQVIKSLLESCEISCLLESNAAPSVFAFTVDGMGLVKVLVDESRAEEAKQIIAREGCV